MGSKKEYEEKQRHGTVALPVGLHKMEYPEGTDVIFYLHWHQEFEFLVLTKGQIVFTIEDREYELHEGDSVFINSNLLHSAKTVDGMACSFFAVVFSYEALDDDYHSAFSKKYIRPVLNGKFILEEYLPIDREGSSHLEFAHPSGDGIAEIDDFPNRFANDIHMSWQQEVIFLLAQISQCPEHELEPHELLVRSRLMSIWNLMYHHGKKNKKQMLEDGTSSERLAPVIQYLKKNYALTISFKAFPALNLGALEAAMCITSPLRGFLPSLAALSDTSKVPNPTNWIFSPFFNSSATTSVKAFNAFSASFLDNSVFFAIAATNSVLFIKFSS